MYVYSFFFFYRDISSYSSIQFYGRVSSIVVLTFGGYHGYSSIAISYPSNGFLRICGCTSRQLRKPPQLRSSHGLIISGIILGVIPRFQSNPKDHTVHDIYIYIYTQYYIYIYIYIVNVYIYIIQCI